eukprot:g7096.t1
MAALMQDSIQIKHLNSPCENNKKDVCKARTTQKRRVADTKHLRKKHACVASCRKDKPSSAPIPGLKRDIVLLDDKLPEYVQLILPYSTDMDAISTTPSSLPNHAFQIFVRLPHGGTIALDVIASDTIDGVKEKIRIREGHPVNQQRLQYRGKDIQGCATLMRLNIQKESTLYMTCRLRGGMFRQLKSASEFDHESQTHTVYNDLDFAPRAFTNYYSAERRRKMQQYDEHFEQTKLRIFDVNCNDSVGSSTTKPRISSRDQIIKMLDDNRDSDYPSSTFPLQTKELFQHQKEALNIHLQQSYFSVDKKDYKDIDYDSYRRQELNGLFNVALEIPNTPLFKLATCSGKSLIECIISLLPSSWIEGKFEPTDPWKSRRTLITSPSGGLLQMAKSFRGYEVGKQDNENDLFSHNDVDDKQYVKEQNMKCLLDDSGNAFDNIYDCPYLHDEAQLLIHIVPGLKKLVWVKIDESRNLLPEYCLDENASFCPDDKHGFTKRSDNAVYAIVSLYYIVYHHSRYINKEGFEPTCFDPTLKTHESCKRDGFLDRLPMVDIINTHFIRRNAQASATQAIFASIYCPDCKNFQCKNKGTDAHHFAPVFLGQDYGIILIDDAHAGNQGYTVVRQDEWKGKGSGKIPINRTAAAELHQSTICYEFTATCEKAIRFKDELSKDTTNNIQERQVVLEIGRGELVTEKVVPECIFFTQVNRVCNRKIDKVTVGNLVSSITNEIKHIIVDRDKYGGIPFQALIRLSNCGLINSCITYLRDYFVRKNLSYAKYYSQNNNNKPHEVEVCYPQETKYIPREQFLNLTRNGEIDFIFIINKLGAGFHSEFIRRILFQGSISKTAKLGKTHQLPQLHGRFRWIKRRTLEKLLKQKVKYPKLTSSHIETFLEHQSEAGNPTTFFTQSFSTVPGGINAFQLGSPVETSEKYNVTVVNGNNVTRIQGTRDTYTITEGQMQQAQQEGRVTIDNVESSNDENYGDSGGSDPDNNIDSDHENNDSSDDSCNSSINLDCASSGSDPDINNYSDYENNDSSDDSCNSSINLDCDDDNICENEGDNDGIGLMLNDGVPSKGDENTKPTDCIDNSRKNNAITECDKSKTSNVKAPSKGDENTKPTDCIDNSRKNNAITECDKSKTSNVKAPSKGDENTKPTDCIDNSRKNNAITECDKSKTSNVKAPSKGDENTKPTDCIDNSRKNNAITECDKSKTSNVKAPSKGDENTKPTDCIDNSRKNNAITECDKSKTSNVKASKVARYGENNYDSYGKAQTLARNDTNGSDFGLNMIASAAETENDTLTNPTEPCSAAFKKAVPKCGPLSRKQNRGDIRRRLTYHNMNPMKAEKSKRTKSRKKREVKSAEKKKQQKQERQRRKDAREKRQREGLEKRRREEERMREKDRRKKIHEEYTSAYNWMKKNSEESKCVPMFDKTRCRPDIMLHLSKYQCAGCPRAVADDNISSSIRPKFKAKYAKLKHTLKSDTINRWNFESNSVKHRVEANARFFLETQEGLASLYKYGMKKEYSFSEKVTVYECRFKDTIKERWRENAKVAKDRNMMNSEGQVVFQEVYADEEFKFIKPQGEIESKNLFGMTRKELELEMKKYFDIKKKPKKYVWVVSFCPVSFLDRALCSEWFGGHNGWMEKGDEKCTMCYINDVKDQIFEVEDGEIHGHFQDGLNRIAKNGKTKLNKKGEMLRDGGLRRAAVIFKNGKNDDGMRTLQMIDKESKEVIANHVKIRDEKTDLQNALLPYTISRCIYIDKIDDRLHCKLVIDLKFLRDKVKQEKDDITLKRVLQGLEKVLTEEKDTWQSNDNEIYTSKGRKRKKESILELLSETFNTQTEIDLRNTISTLRRHLSGQKKRSKASSSSAPKPKRRRWTASI